MYTHVMGIFSEQWTGKFSQNLFSELNQKNSEKKGIKRRDEPFSRNFSYHLV